MAARLLISGSIAYDSIMVFDGHFKDHILPDRVHMLNVAFLVPQLKREFGGTAANIAYNAALLGAAPAVLATVGRDGAEYVEHLAGLGIDVRAVRRIDAQYSAQAFITTDLADNQITAFHPGAMNEAHAVRVADALPGAWGIVSPNGRQAMLDHARQFAEAGLPWIFDPGQGLPMFDGEDLRALVEAATAVAVNDYECGMLVQRTGWSEEEIARRVDALVVTRGGEGSVVWTGGDRQVVPAAPIARAVDPTGCGDAYRGGLLHALAQGRGWTEAARLGSVMGAIKIEHAGAQNHRPSRDEIARRHREAYGAAPW